MGWELSRSSLCAVQKIPKLCNHWCQWIEDSKRKLTRQRRVPHRQWAEEGRPRQACPFASSELCTPSALRHQNTTTYKIRTQIHTGSSPTLAQKKIGARLTCGLLCTQESCASNYCTVTSQAGRHMLAETLHVGSVFCVQCCLSDETLTVACWLPLHHEGIAEQKGVLSVRAGRGGLLRAWREGRCGLICT